MKMEVLRVMSYRKHLIHIMHFNNVFQYLFSDKDGKIYQDHIFFPASFWNFIKYKLNLRASPYTVKEKEAGEDIVLNGAIVSIDALEDKKE